MVEPISLAQVRALPDVISNERFALSFHNDEPCVAVCKVEKFYDKLHITTYAVSDNSNLDITSKRGATLVIFDSTGVPRLKWDFTLHFDKESKESYGNFNLSCDPEDSAGLKLTFIFDIIRVSMSIP